MNNSSLKTYSAIVRQSPDRKLYNKFMWFVYALYNAESGKIYIGETGNLEQRLEEHNKKRSNHFTAKVRGNWVLVYKEQVENRTEALTREKQLKSHKGRDLIRQIIKE